MQYLRYCLLKISAIWLVLVKSVGQTKMIRDKIFKNGTSEIYERRPSKNLKWCDLLKQYSCIALLPFHIAENQNNM